MWRRGEELRPGQPAPEAIDPGAPAPVEREAPAAEARPSGTVLSRGIALQGELASREDVYLDGEFQGKVSVEGATLTIGPNGRVSAEVEAKEIIVAGRISGDLRAQERLLVRSSGAVEGDLAAKRLAIEDGAFVRGRIEMTRPEEEPVERTAGTAASAAMQQGSLQGVAMGAGKFAES